MKELENEVSKLLMDYFNKKIEKVNWRSDEVEQDVRSIIDELDEAIGEVIRNTALEIDKKIEEAEAEYNPSFYEEMGADMAFRQNELARCQ